MKIDARPLMPKRQATDQELLDILNSGLPSAIAKLGIPIGSGYDLRTAAFRKKYEFDPVAFVHDCFYWKDGRGPTDYQNEILAMIPDKKRVSVRGPRGLGKSACLSWAIIWYALTRDGDDWKVYVTASSFRQVKEYLWPEIHKWCRLLRWDILGREPFDEREELLGLRLRLKTGHAFAAVSNRPDLVEGTHADRLMYVFDESKAIPDTTFDAAEGAFAGAGEGGTEAYVLAFSTPGAPVGRFYSIQSRSPGYDDWFPRRVTLDEVLASGRATEEWVENRRKQWGENSAAFKHQVLGEFASDDIDGVVPLEWIEASHERWKEWMESGGDGKLSAMGVDLGGGGDDTVICPIFGDDYVGSLKYVGKNEDTMAVVSNLIHLVADYGGDAAVQPIIVDSIGIGAGVVSRLRELRKNVRPFNAATRTTARDQTGELGFANYRAQAWWTLRELLDPANSPTLCLPPDDRLTGDLVAPHYRTLSGPVGRIIVEGKKEVRKRIGRSTDAADAVIMGLVGKQIGLGSSLDFLDSGVYTCKICQSPVFDFGDSSVICPHCGNANPEELVLGFYDDPILPLAPDPDWDDPGGDC